MFFGELTCDKQEFRKSIAFTNSSILCLDCLIIFLCSFIEVRVFKKNFESTYCFKARLYYFRVRESCSQNSKLLVFYLNIPKLFIKWQKIGDLNHSDLQHSKLIGNILICTKFIIKIFFRYVFNFSK